MDKVLDFFRRVREKTAPVFEKMSEIFATIGNVLRKIGRFFFLIRKLLLAIPVVVGALYMAQYAKEHLPAQVGLLIQESGAYTYVIDQSVAITGCLAVTAACLLLMFCSRRTIYPWLISIFSLILPLVLLLTNIFPA